MLSVGGGEGGASGTGRRRLSGSLSPDSAPPQHPLTGPSQPSEGQRPPKNHRAGPLGSRPDWSAGCAGPGGVLARGREARAGKELSLSPCSLSTRDPFSGRRKGARSHLLGRLAAEARALAVRLIGRRLRHVLARRLHACCASAAGGRGRRGVLFLSSLFFFTAPSFVVSGRWPGRGQGGQEVARGSGG